MGKETDGEGMGGVRAGTSSRASTWGLGTAVPGPAPRADDRDGKVELARLRAQERSPSPSTAKEAIAGGG